MLTKIELLALGIRPDTDPNNPDTWSDELKINHKRVLKALGPESKKVTVKPSGSVAGKSGSFTPIEGKKGMYGEPVESGLLSGQEVSKENERVQSAISALDMSDLEKGATPRDIDSKFWESLSKDTKSAVQKYIRLHREYVAKYSKDGKLPSKEYLKENYRWNATGAVGDHETLKNTLQSVMAGIGRDAFKSGERVDDSEYDIDPGLTDYRRELAISNHQKELGARKAIVHLMPNYPAGFKKDEYDPSDLGIRTASEAELSASKTKKSSGSKSKPAPVEDDYDDMEEMDDYECETCGNPAVTYDDENGYLCKDCMRDVYGTTGDDEEEPEEEPEDSTPTRNPDAQAEQDNAIKVLTEVRARNGKKSSGYGAVDDALNRVAEGGADTQEEERERIKQILIEEHGKYKKGSVMRGELSVAASRLGHDLTEQTPSVEEQKQQEAEAGSNISTQMIEGGVAPGKDPGLVTTTDGRLVTTTDSFTAVPNVMYTASNGATHEQRAVTGSNSEVVGHVGIWKNKAGRVIGLYGPYKLEEEADPESEMQAMAKHLSQKLDASIKKNPELWTMDNLPGGQELKVPTNDSMYTQLMNHSPDSEFDEDEESAEETAEPESTYTGPGSVEHANKEGAPISKGVMPDGSSPTWGDVHQALQVATKKTSKPASKKYLMKISPDLGKHVVDITNLFYKISDHTGFSAEGKQSALEEIKRLAGPIYDFVKNKAETTPGEPATDLPNSLRQDNMIRDYTHIIASKDSAVDESTGLTKEGKDIYQESARLAEQAKSESNPRSANYEAWVAQKKAEGWTDWKAEKPMSSEDLAAQKKQASASRTKSVKIPTAGSTYSSTLPKEQRFDTDLRPTNVSKDHWTALKEYSKEAAGFVSMYVHKWHNLVDSGAIAPEGKVSTGEPQIYTIEQLKADKQAILNKFTPQRSSGTYYGASNDKKYKLKPLLAENGGLVHSENGAADKINEILKAYPIPE